MNNLEKKYFSEWNTHFKSVIEKNFDNVTLINFVKSNQFNFSLIDLIPVNNTHGLWFLLSLRKDLTIEILEEYIEKPWVWMSISTRNILTPEFIVKHPEINYVYEFLSKNTNIPFDFVVENHEKNWNWHAIRNRLKLTDEEIIFNFDKPWIIKYIDRGANESVNVLRAAHLNPSITNELNWISITWNAIESMIMQSPDLPWIPSICSEKYDMSSKFFNDNIELFKSVKTMIFHTVAVIDKIQKKIGISFNDILNDNGVNRLLKKMRKYPKVKWSWKMITKKIPPVKMDFLKASDINSGWKIPSLIKNKITTLRFIKAKFPDEFKILYQTNTKIKSMYGALLISEAALTNQTESYYHMVKTNYNLPFIKKNFILSLIIKDGLFEFNNEMFDSVESLKIIDSKIAELEPMYLKQWYSFYNSIIENQSKQINWFKIVSTENFNFDLLDLVSRNTSVWRQLSKRNDITEEILDKHLYKPWDWETISSRNIITPEFINRNPDSGIYYSYLSANTKIPLSFVIDNYQRNWHWKTIRQRFHLSDEEILDNLEKPWIINYINYGGDMSEKILRAVHSNPRLTRTIHWSKLTAISEIKTIAKTADLPWNFDFVLSNFSLEEKHINEIGEFIVDFRKHPRIYYFTTKTLESVLKDSNLVEYDDETTKTLLEILRRYPKIDWKWNIISEKISLNKMNFLLPSDINSGWRITSMIKHGITTLEYIMSTFPIEFQILCDNNDKIRTMYEATINQQESLTPDIISYDSKLQSDHAISIVKKNFIANLIKRDGLEGFKEKIKKVNDEFNEKICNPDNFEKLKELKCFESVCYFSDR